MVDGKATETEYVGKAIFVYFLAGLGIGLVVLLLGEIGSIPFEGPYEDLSDSEASQAEELYYADFAVTMVTLATVLTPILGALTGFWGGIVHSDLNQGIGYSALVGLLGGVLFVLLVGSLSFLVITEEAGEMMQIKSLDVAALLMSGLISAAGTAMVSAGTAYAAN